MKTPEQRLEELENVKHEILTGGVRNFTVSTGLSAEFQSIEALDKEIQRLKFQISRRRSGAIKVVR